MALSPGEQGSRDRGWTGLSCGVLEAVRVSVQYNIDLRASIHKQRLPEVFTWA
jgi:hypothetical protein